MLHTTFKMRNVTFNLPVPTTEPAMTEAATTEAVTTETPTAEGGISLFLIHSLYVFIFCISKCEVS